MRLQPPYDQRYTVQGSLGTGAQATVYVARDETSGQQVALKLLGLGSGERDATRLLREARALASVVHPALPRFYELHADHDPPLLVMEAVEGTELRQALEQGRTWSPDQLAPVGQALAEGLAMLHAKGVLHRDLKPENVILAEEGPRLIDLGLAQLDGESRITRTGAAVGTPLYFSPEQFEKRPSTPASDVFSLGVILHEMLVGERPYSLFELTAKARTEEWPRQPQVRLTEALGRVAGRALERDPRRRPDAEELAVALRHGGTWETRETTRPELLQGKAGPAPRGRAGMLVLLGVGVALGAWMAGGAPRPGPAGLVLRPAPGGVEVSWAGASSDGGLEFQVEDGPRVALPSDAGPQRLHIPLPARSRLRLMRGDQPVAAGSPPRTWWEVAPAPVPPGSATRLLRGPGGLSLALDSESWPWAPERIELRNGAVSRTLSRADGPGPARYPIEGPLDGNSPTEVWPLSQGPGDSWTRIGDAPWFRWEGAVQQRRVHVAPDGTSKYGPARPAQTADYELVRLPHILLAPRTYSARHLAASQQGERRLWFPMAMGTKGYVISRSLDPSAPFYAFELAPNSAFLPRTAHVLDLGRSLAFHYHEEATRGDAGKLWVWRGGGNIERMAVDDAIFHPVGGPYLTGDGRAFYLGERLRIRRIDEDGRLGPPEGLPSMHTHVARAGDQRSGERWLALALHDGKGEAASRHAVVLVDRQDPTRRALLEGLPEALPSHPLVLEQGPHAGLYLALGDRILKIALADLLPAPGEVERRTTMEEVVRSRALETVVELRGRDPGANLLFPRGHPLSGGPYGLLPVVEPVEVPGDTPEYFLGQPVGFRRFRALVLGHREPHMVDLDAGPFPAVPTGIPQVAGSLDGRRGLAVLLTDGHGARMALELLDLASGHVLIRWGLQVSGWALSPTLLGDRIFLGISPSTTLEATLPPLGPMSP